ncbi:adenylosuccinate synthase [Chryseobacterium sp. SORGH_AS909]|uniref:adenylosuccinate synthetase n=1 Tax=unclassified Chryseobacterium TaxID=2593645 RepID=UPI00278242BC|nr:MULTISPECIES: adenylosuccinate synthetase [unclassified Chryseobacterium]MDQ1102157.1 adenylosuccinate synthase [Chryseobacterium sp. SORGH_AS_1048]MDR6085595.1 adenylosuccinate synthase [Chryseobacterium sp. SORGH_AS_0909]MDR6129957.1 adenylosuccinate synthase [Chryseobacterium sp. SORGH_AS_1175]MDT3407913.1 adenylosuccinate synthase [Pseudacidovorax intermedius]
MKTADIIIGLGFGDEGKGITTDFLAARNPDAVVIRFSGGQQAAHTVMIDDRKHIHSSFCSGALRGLPSYFTEHCTIHPVFMYNEWKELKSKNGNTSLHIHPLAKVTTPFDVLHNRKDVRNTEHGTCGKGVGATMKRHESPYRLFAADLIAPRSMLIEKLKGIASYYGFSDGEEIQAALDDFLYAIDQMEWKIEGYKYLNTFDHLIFEGSQGILLDMDHGVFPNVTYAHTTSKNAHEVCKQIGIDQIEMYYVTRSYATRHGNGWMSSEKELSLQNNEEETCIFNEYQGVFRTGYLDYELLNYALKVDEGYRFSDRKNLVVTCLDQLDVPFKLEKLEVKFDAVFGSHAPYSNAFRRIDAIFLKQE